MTFKNDAELLQDIIEIFAEEFATILDIQVLMPALAFEPMSLNIIQHMTSNGGNILGISTDNGPLIIVNVKCQWTNSADDTRIFMVISSFMSRNAGLSVPRGLDDHFIHMNYASLDQDVFAGYGQENVKKLKSIQNKYDLTGVFKQLQPGYFKI
ncbi:hypothetical protein B0J14DRAFT_555835 [Halenospora varia]|nr:hypothetical protein B0J14DRAFT_555835 [Halenospora varia]